MSFIEELSFTTGKDSQGNEYYEIDSHMEVEGVRKFIRVTPSKTIIKNGKEVATVKIQERIGETLTQGVELPMGCQPALMEALIKATIGG